MIAALAALAPACEDEQPSLPRGGEQAQGQEQGQAQGQAQGQEKGQEKGQGEAAVDGKAPARPATRVPSASEIMGYKKAGQADDGSGLVPAYLRGNRRPGGPSPLFIGKSVRPSSRYLNMKTTPVPVSPLERHWQSGDGPRDVVKKRKKAADIIAAIDDGGEGLFDGEAPKPGKETRPGVKTETAASGYGLLLYRLDPQSGEVEVFKRKFTTAEARDAAKRFARQEGYKHKPPTKKQIARIKGKAEPKVAEKKEDKRKEKADAADKCPFKASWTETVGDKQVGQSRCFQSKEAVDGFVTQRRKAAAAAQKKAAEAKQPPKPASGADDSLAPTKLE